MRKLGVLAAAAGLAVSGSIAKADFVITSTRANNAVTVSSGQNQGTYDVVSFSIVNNGANGTGTTINSVDVGLYSSQGMLIGVGNGAKGGLPATAADIFATNSANFTGESWIADNTSPFNLTSTSGGSVLLFGANPNTTAGVTAISQTFNNNDKVAGISGTIFATNPTPPQDATGVGVQFAQAVVPHGAPVSVLNPVTGRPYEQNSGIFSPLNGSFQATNNTTANGPYTDGVPEPGSIALFGIGAAGLLARRRRKA